MIKIDNACGAKTSVWVCAPVCTCVSFCVSVWETRGKPRASGSWTPHMPHHSPSLPSAEAEAAERRDNAFITVNSSSRQRVVNARSITGAQIWLKVTVQRTCLKKQVKFTTLVKKKWKVKKNFPTENTDVQDLRFRENKQNPNQTIQGFQGVKTKLFKCTKKKLFHWRRKKQKTKEEILRKRHEVC